MKKVDGERNGQEDKKGYQVEKFFPFSFHTINRYLIVFIFIISYIYFIGFKLRRQVYLKPGVLSQKDYRIDYNAPGINNCLGFRNPSTFALSERSLV